MAWSTVGMHAEISDVPSSVLRVTGGNVSSSLFFTGISFLSDLALTVFTFSVSGTTSTGVGAVLVACTELEMGGYLYDADDE